MENQNTHIGNSVSNKFQSGGDFDKLNKVVMAYAEERIKAADGVIFKVKVNSRHEVFETYLNGFLTAVDKQDHNCNCCKGFLRRYGNLAILDEDCRIKSLLWNEDIVDDFYKQSIANMRLLVESSQIESVFYRPITPSDSFIVGDVEKGGFHHFAFSVKNINKYNDELILSDSAAAISRENFKITNINLKEFSKEVVTTVLDYFKLDAKLKVHTSHIANLAWFAELKNATSRYSGQQVSRNIVWKAIATASSGKIKIASTVVGEFLKSRSTGTSYETAKANFLKMTDASKYMRPTVAPSEGAVQAAERIFKELDLEASLDRRFLRIDEIINWVWQPKEAIVDPSDKKGIFSDLVTKEGAAECDPGQVNGGSMSWVEFEKEILPKADKVSVFLNPAQRYLFGGMTQATNPDSKPILVWDSLEKRNTISGYVRSGGAYPVEFGINESNVEIVGVTYTPSEILSDVETQSRFLILKGAKDCSEKGGLALFPAILRPELYRVRSVIEAYSNTHQLGKVDNPVCGLFLPVNNANEINITFAVTVGKFVVKYTVNRYM